MKQKLRKLFGYSSKDLPPPHIGVVGKESIDSALTAALGHLHQLGRIQLAGIWKQGESDRMNLNASLPTPPIPTFSNLDVLLANSKSVAGKKLDAILILGNSDWQSECIRKALSLKFHVLTKSPLAENSSEGAALIESASSAGAHLGVLHPERYRAIYAEPLGTIRTGSLGEILSVRFDRPYNKGELNFFDEKKLSATLYDDLYLARACAFSPVTSIQARIEEHKNPKNHVTSQQVQLHHAGGGSSIIQRIGSYSSSDEKIEVHGTKGSLRICPAENVWFNWEGNTTQSETRGKRMEPNTETLRGGETLKILSKDSNVRSLARALDDTFASFQRGLPSPVDSREAWHNLKALDAAKESIRTGEIVRMEIPFPR